MLELHTEIEIEAPAARVWQVLTEFGAYPSWNPFLPRIDGVAKAGEKIEVTFHPPGGKAMTMKPTVLTADEGRRLSWLGRLGGVPKLFDGEHAFEIVELGENRVRFVQSEKFGGVLVPFLRKMLETKTRAGFEAMNRALKDRAESSVA